MAILSIEEAQLRLNELKQAVSIEKKHRYIDVRGKKKSFSDFVRDSLQEFQGMRLNEHAAILGLIGRFKNYRFMDLNARMSALEHMEAFLREFSLTETHHKTALQDARLIHTSPVTTEAEIGLQDVVESLYTKGFPIDRSNDLSNKGIDGESSAGFEPNAPLHQIPVQFVKGVGPKFARILDQVNIRTVEDLLYYFPRRYLDYNNRVKISQLTEGQEVTILGEIRSVSAYQPQSRNITIVSVTIADDTGMIHANWFYGKSSRAQLESYKSRFIKGAEVMVSGRVKWDRFKRTFAIDRGELEILSYQDEFNGSGSDSLHAGRIVPVYPLCEGLNLRSLRRAIHQALQTYLPRIADPLPDEIQQRYQLNELQTALKQIHFPIDQSHFEQARRRLVFDELFYLQVRLALIRQNYKRNAKAFSFRRQPGGYADQLVERLPFTLTNAQRRVFDEILTDLGSGEPMYRLLQGDVGSGKTIVAALSLLVSVENGYQGALMAPTEILAEQHYRRFIEWLTPLGLKVGLFVGKSGQRERRELRQGLLNGQIHIAVGTHALIQDDVEFHKLGVVVVDEQHRFGVKQRTLLKAKGEHPEMLTMTATPIPRTLALTAHGDLDVSIIDELPPGRTPIKTTLLTNKQHQQAYQLVRYEIQQGRQAYVVFPLIEESETLSAKAATKEAERLQNEVFPDLKVGLLHGKMKPEEKDAVMQAFLHRHLDILVSTTVIEVGVDVPNATVMIIENADRFGLAQLHQLRGRVGRGQHQSYCVLVSDSRGEETMHRLGILCQTEDGFVIAEKDLEIRGPGEFLGTRQSGLPDLALADIIQDREILDQARACAFELIAHPDTLHQHPLLEAMIYQKTEDAVSVLGSG